MRRSSIVHALPYGALLLPALFGLQTALGGEAAFSVAAILRDDEAFDRPHDVELQGNLAFVPGKGGSLAVVDVTDPEDPKILWCRRDAQELDDAETVLPLGDYLLLGTNDLISIDVSDPRSPRFLKTISDRRRISRINGMARLGNRVFAASKDGWVDVFDVADPASPTFLGALNTRQNGKLGWPHDIDVFGDCVVIVDPAGFGKRGLPGKVGLYRVADPVTDEPLPVEAWPLVGVLVSHDLVGANRVQVKGHYAFVGGSQGDKPSNAVTVDLSDPTRPVQAAVVRFSDTRGPNGLTIAGDVLFLAGGQTVEAIDVRDPAKPVKLASYKCPEAFPAGRDSAHDLVYRDGYLYVTGQNDHCLCILRVDSPLIRDLAAR